MSISSGPVFLWKQTADRKEDTPESAPLRFALRIVNVS